MCKKILFAALIAVAGVAAYRHFKVRLSLGEEPIEAQIKRERDKLPLLDAEIKKYISEVAGREVEVKNLAADIKKLEEQQQKHRDALRTKKAELQAVKDTAKADP